MKLWIKGGLWAIGIYLLIMVLSFTLEDGFIWFMLSPGTWVIVGGNFGSAGWTAELKQIMQFVTSLISWGIVGASIGLVIGKIKSR